MKLSGTLLVVSGGPENGGANPHGRQSQGRCGRLPLGLDAVGEAIGPVVADVVFGQLPVHVVYTTFPDQNRVGRPDVELRRNEIAGKTGRYLLLAGLDHDAELLFENVVERLRREMFLSRERDAGVEVGDEIDERALLFPRTRSSTKKRPLP